MSKIPIELSKLIQRFSDNEKQYKSSTYNEASLRQDFLDPFLQILGWDVGNKADLPEHLREVAIEKRISIEGSKKAPDYELRIGGRPTIFLEAKRPSIKVEENPESSHQIRKYGWNAKVKCGVLCDFEELAIYDTRVKPDITDNPRIARIKYINFRQYGEQWDWIQENLSRNSVNEGAIFNLFESSEFKKTIISVDDYFLEQLEKWRKELANNIHRLNSKLDAHEIGESVQLILDRIVFLRICEDRLIEPDNQLLKIAKLPNIYRNLLTLFQVADSKYNSGLFHITPEKNRKGNPDKLTQSLTIDDHCLREILTQLYWPLSPFNFKLMAPQVLGSVYEQFLGKVITLNASGKLTIEEKPEVKKSGGVVYTPESVVNYMINVSLEKQLESLSLKAILNSKNGKSFSIVDPACGSGSFLIAVYQKLLDWYLTQYTKDKAKWNSGKNLTIFQTSSGWALTTAERKRILIDHIYGVDIDPQAVEVTKLSLLLKVLENESLENLEMQLSMFHERALPNLDLNIRSGNSLVDSEYLDLEPKLFKDEERSRQMNLFNWAMEFPSIFSHEGGGFDLVIGNPPYVLLQGELGDPVLLAYLKNKYSVASYKVDLYHLFVELSLDIAASGGFVCLITPTNYLTNNYLVELRRLLLKESKIQQIAVLDSAVFPKRSVDCAILTTESQSETKTFFVKKIKLVSQLDVLKEESAVELSQEIIGKSPSLLFTGGGKKSISDVCELMESAEFSLVNLSKINFGKQLRDRKIWPKDVLSVSSTSKVPRSHRACYTGKDILPWNVTWNGLACLNSKEAQSGGCWDPSVQNSKNKLVCRQIGFFPEFAIDKLGYQCLNTLFMLKPEEEIDSYYLLGILNSTAIKAFWIERFWDRRRTFPKIKGTYLKLLPLPVTYDEEISNLAAELSNLAVKSVETLSPKKSQAVIRQREMLLKRLDLRVLDLYGIPQELAPEIDAFVLSVSQAVH